MPTFTFSVKVNNVQRVLSKINSVVDKTLNEIGDKAVDYTKNATPVDTGALRDSYKKEVNVSGKYLRVGSELEYAPYVELGTGPNYQQPPDWVRNSATRGYHLTDPWWYLDANGDWQLGWFVTARPHLRPAFLNHADEYMQIFEKHLKNA